LVPYPAALDVPHAIVEAVTMAVISREGERRCRLRPSQRVLCALVYLRKNETFAQVAAGWRVGVATAWRYVWEVIGHLAALAPTLREVLEEAEPDWVLVDGLLARCDQVGDGRADYSAKHREHGVNVQVVTDPAGRVLWLSPALPGRANDLAAAREHEIPDVLAELDIAGFADKAYVCRGGHLATPIKRKAGRDLCDKHRRHNRVHARIRGPVERGVATAKHWRVLRGARCSPSRMSRVIAAILTLTIYT
jgi:hypothetical protein